MNQSTKGNEVDDKIQASNLYFDIDETQVPLIFSDKYNIRLFGMEKLHPFDAGKWGKIIELLKSRKNLKSNKITIPKEATISDLLVVHTSRYIKSLKWSVKVAQITEVAPAALLPNFVLQNKILKPFRYQTGGTILGGKLAMETGWSINVGGGFHHCSANQGGGFCAYADITLCVKFLMAHFKNISRVMIIDLDAHQGNGYQRDFMGDKDIYILDVYNKEIYPKDIFAKTAIDRPVELTAFIQDDEYLNRIRRHVEGALNEFQPQFVIYNAGTDILKGDSLGLMCISGNGVIKRDEIVWNKVRSRDVPILMLTSGGYQRCNAAVIADSISNLHDKELIDLKPG